MGVIIPEGFGQATFRWRVVGDNEEMVITLGYEGTNPQAVGTHASIFASAWQTAYPASSLSDEYTFVGVTTRSVPVGQSFPLIGEAVVNQAGTSVADVPPNNCALLIDKRTLLGGRQGKGRLYVPIGYVAEVEVSTSGVIDAGEVTEEQGRIDAFFADITGDVDFERLVLLHSQSPPAPTTIDSFIVQSKIATQRTRMRR